jgi:adenylate cyclase class 2
MQYEVEIKLPLGDMRQTIEEQLDNAGAEFVGLIRQSDHYFNHPQRDFAVTDEALRIRSVNEKNWITWKGPKIDSRTKTRREIELPLGDSSETAAGFAEILTLLSFRSVATVVKDRRVYRMDFKGAQCEIALDDVVDVGSFLEIELIADESNLASAQDTVVELGSLLGLHETEQKSYLEMLLEQKNRQGD